MRSFARVGAAAVRPRAVAGASSVRALPMGVRFMSAETFEFQLPEFKTWGGTYFAVCVHVRARVCIVAVCWFSLSRCRSPTCAVGGVTRTRRN